MRPACNGWRPTSSRTARPCRDGTPSTGTPSRASWRIGGHEDDREAVIALVAHGLHHRGFDARLGGDEIEHAPHALNGRVGARRIHDLAIAHDIVDNDQA